MSKIKVVQVAIAASDDDTWSYVLLDNQGRIWDGVWSAGKFRCTQLELPDEPDEETK